MRLKGLMLSFTALLTLTMVHSIVFSKALASEPVMGSEVNEDLIAQINAENEQMIPKTQPIKSERLPASLEENEKPEK